MKTPAVTITRIACAKVRLPFDHGGPPPKFAGVPRTTLDSGWLRVELSSGHVGWGEAYAADLDALCAIVRNRVAPLALGRDPLDAGLMPSLERTLHNMGRSGPVQHALSGLDIALWDLRGKLAGLPLHRLIGGAQRKTVRAYASLLQYYGDCDAVARNVDRSLKAGFGEVKLHERTAEAVAAARNAAGGKTPLMVDTNCAWDPKDAAAEIDRMRASQPFWIEEPTWPPEDLGAMRALRQRTPFAIAAGENAASVLELEDMVRTGAVDWVQPCAIKCGGVSTLLRVAEVCRQHPGAGFSPQMAFFGPGFLATLHVLAAQPRDVAIERLFCDLRVMPYRSTVPLEHGAFRLPEAPGLGADPDEEMLSAMEWPDA